MVGEVSEKVNTKDRDSEKREQIERGKRIKKIREEKLKMNKTEFGRRIGISGQFVGLVEEGKGNITYKSLKKLMKLSEHSADYILYGLDDSIISETKRLLKRYEEHEIIRAISVLREIALFINEE